MISVIIPSYNHALYLTEALESVFAQTFSSIEVIVVDNASTDDSERVISAYQDRIIYHKMPSNLDASAARNLGVDIASGEYVAFLDSDDLWSPDKLLLQYEAIHQSSGPNMVFGYAQNFHSPELSSLLKKQLYCPPTPLPAYIPSTFLIRKDCFLNVGLFNTNLKMGEFIDWYIKAKHMGLTDHVIPATLAFRRIHAGHIGKKVHHQDYCQILKNKIRLQKKAIEELVDAE